MALVIGVGVHLCYFIITDCQTDHFDASRACREDFSSTSKKAKE